MPKFGADKPTPAWLMILVALLGSGGATAISGYLVSRQQVGAQYAETSLTAIMQDKEMLRVQLNEKDAEINRLHEALSQQRATADKNADRARDAQDRAYLLSRDLREENQRLRMELLRNNLPLPVPPPDHPGPGSRAPERDTARVTAARTAPDWMEVLMNAGLWTVRSRPQRQRWKLRKPRR